MEMEGSDSELEGATRRRVCDCGREAVEKVAGPRSPNRGLRYLCCDRFVFFGKKKNYCRFFEWIDPPRVTQEQKEEARSGKCPKKEDDFLNNTALQPASNTESADRHSKAFEEWQVNKENIELETRSTSLQPQIYQDAINAAIKSSVGAQNSADCRQQAVCVEDASSLLKAQTGNDLSGAEQQHSSSTHGNNRKTDRSNFNGVQSNTQVGHAADFHVVHDEVLTTNQNDMQSHAIVHDISEPPNCLCSRAAFLKTVKSRGPNQGLRFWVCANSRPFYVKKKRGISKDSEENCKFFRWIDTPSEKSDIQKSEEKQRRKENQKKRELSILS